MTAAVEAWVRNHLGARATIGEPLVGGVTSQVRRVDAHDRSFVLKQVTNARWLAERPDVVGYEAKVLEMLGTDTSLPVPEVVAVDATGAEAGDPSMLITHIDAAPAGSLDRPDDVLEPLAETAVAIGEVEPPSWVRPFVRYLDASEASPPLWTTVEPVWERAIDALAGAAPDTEPRFIHRDYHHWNVLWHDEVVGIVDWSQTSIGPASMDIAHCRMNLATQFGVGAADRFRDAWQERTGLRHHPYFDIVTVVDLLPDWRPRDRENRILDDYLTGLVGEL
ncbi:MAG: aminoglycoside phosphotransferase family protein [Acidimicrobiia bacterium]|nr:aminoglycoside phosphotransferase family protein [Acidimicrobiia bacterium]